MYVVTVVGNLLVTGGWERILLWDLETHALVGSVVAHPESHLDAVTWVDSLLFTGSEHGAIKSWLLPELKAQRDFNGHAMGVTRLCANADLLISSSYDHTIRVWRNVTGICISVLQCGDPVRTLVVDWKQDMLICGGDFGIQQWQLSSGKRLKRLVTQSKAMAIELNKERTILYVLYENKSLVSFSVPEMTIQAKKIELPFEDAKLQVPGLCLQGSTLIANNWYVLVGLLLLGRCSLFMTVGTRKSWCSQTCELGTPK